MMTLQQREKEKEHILKLKSLHMLKECISRVKGTGVLDPKDPESLENLVDHNSLI